VTNRRRTGAGPFTVVAAVLAVLLPLIVQPARAAGGPRTLHVGSGEPYASIQDAVNAASPGDWILIEPGDYHEHGAEHAGVLITTPGLHLRGLDRSAVIVDGTRAGAPQPCDPDGAWQDFGPPDSGGKPTGRNGIEVYKADGVTIENLTVCNFLAAAGGGNGNQIWWNGGDGSGKVALNSLAGQYLTATSTYFKDGNSAMAQYGIFTSNERGPGIIAHSYASNMGDSSYYVGACPDCNVILTDAHAQNSALGYSGTNGGGHLLILNSEWDHNRAGIAPNTLNNDDAPSPQNGACPAQPKKSCTIIAGNLVHDNNNPNAPGSGIAGSSPVGAGIIVSGGRNDTVTDNRVWNQGAWGIIINDYPDTSTPPKVAHCEGGIKVPGVICYFQAFGSRIDGNVLTNNGFFGNVTNGDLADATLPPTPGQPGNCFVHNIDTGGRLTSDPPAIQLLMGTCGSFNLGGDLPLLAVQLLCSTGMLPCGSYPKSTGVRMVPLPPGLATMPNPCAGGPEC
jgi:hypothetical protein